MILLMLYYLGRVSTLVIISESIRLLDTMLNPPTYHEFIGNVAPSNEERQEYQRKGIENENQRWNKYCGFIYSTANCYKKYYRKCKINIGCNLNDLLFCSCCLTNPLKKRNQKKKNYKNHIMHIESEIQQSENVELMAGNIESEESDNDGDDNDNKQKMKQKKEKSREIDNTNNYNYNNNHYTYDYGYAPGNANVDCYCGV